MTMPKFSIRPALNWLASQFGAVLLAVVCAGAVALASTKFVTHEVLHDKAVTPLQAEILTTKAQGETLSSVASKTAELEKRDSANATADEKRDVMIRALLETTQSLAVEVKANAEKTRGHDAQIVALQSTTAGIRTEIAVVQANQVAAAKQSDRIEDKLDRLIEGRSK